MSNKTSAILPRQLYLSATTRQPTRLDRVVERQLDGRTWDGLFALSIAAFAIVTALGIVG